MKLIDYYRVAEKFNSKHSVYVIFKQIDIECDVKINEFMTSRDYEWINKDDCFITEMSEHKQDILLRCSYLPGRKK